jgi:hypothetical protein
MNNIAEIIIVLLVVVNLATINLKNCPIKTVNFILLLQASVSYGVGLFAPAKIAPLIFGINILIDLVAFDLIATNWRKAAIKKFNAKYLIDAIQMAVLAMIVTHFFAVFNVIKTYDMYFAILNTLSLVCVSLGLVGGIAKIKDGMANNKDNRGLSVVQSGSFDKGAIK